MDHKLLYHITDVNNLPSILDRRALAAHSQVTTERISYYDIAHRSIQDRRGTTEVPVPPYGMLHDYVPFYFAPRSPMLYAIKQGSVENYKGKQSEIIYLVSKTDIMARYNKDFVLTDGHGIMALREFYKDLEDLNEVDWHVMESKYWNDDEENPDRKRRRQAEFLVHGQVELNCFLGIGVYNEQMKEKVNDILKEHHIDMNVLVRPWFYF